MALSQVMRCDTPGELSVPNHLSLGNDGRLYLTRSVEGKDAKLKPQPINLKESLAWFRVGHECGWNLVHGDAFGDWLKLIERALP